MKKLVCGVFLAVLMQGAALAQTWEVGVFGAYPRWGRAPLGSLSETPVNTDTRLKGEYTLGARITLNSRGYYGHELGYSIQRMTFRTNFSTTLSDGTAFSASLEDKVKLQRASYNFLAYFMPAGERWRPFVTVGVQGYKYSAPHFSQWPGGGSKNFGLNWGGGLKLKLLPHTMLRLDARDYIGGKPYSQLQFDQNTFRNGYLHLLEGSVGFSISF